MNPLNENEIELLAIQQLQAQGYTYLNGPTIAPDGSSPQRDSYEDVLLIGRLEAGTRNLA